MSIKRTDADFDAAVTGWYESKKEIERFRRLVEQLELDQRERGADIMRLQAEVDRLKADAAKWIQAVGLASTIVGDMEIDVSDPVGMMQKVVAEVERLEAEVKELRSWYEDGLECAAVIAEGMAEEVTDSYSGRGMTCVRIAAAIRAKINKEQS